MAIKGKSKRSQGRPVRRPATGPRIQTVERRLPWYRAPAFAVTLAVVALVGTLVAAANRAEEGWARDDVRRFTADLRAQNITGRDSHPGGHRRTSATGGVGAATLTTGGCGAGAAPDRSPHPPAPIAKTATKRLDATTESAFMLLVFFVLLFAFGWFAHWVITTFFPEPIRTPAMLFVGVALLIILVYVMINYAGLSGKKLGQLPAPVVRLA